MSNVVIPDNPEYTEILREIETTDLVHADVMNPLLRTLLLNTVYLYRKVTKLKEQIDKMATDNTYGGSNLSNITMIDSEAQFEVIRKTSSSSTSQLLFEKTVNVRKGLYSVLIRLKVSSIADGNDLIQIKVTSSNGTTIEGRVITAKVFEASNVYQTFGFNADIGDATITAILLKNKANITVSVDYMMLQPAQTAITSL